MYKTGLLVLFAIAGAFAQPKIAAPRIWNDRDLAEWATPVAALKVRPGHLSEKEYYSVPAGEWVRTYPVYMPGREPEGYWQMLQSKKPEPLITPEARTESEWIAVGKRIYREMDVPGFRTYDAKFIAKLRSPEEFRKSGRRAMKDGTITRWRWAPTAKGVALTIPECSGCHARILPDGTQLDGAQSDDPTEDVFFEILQAANETFLPGDSQATATWRQFAVPWISNDIHDQIKDMKWPEIVALLKSNPGARSHDSTGARGIPRQSST